ncbi:MAG: hypothetical protein R2875_02225 [Desulfobacterales bacterium]
MPGGDQEWGGIIRHGAKLLLVLFRSHRAQIAGDCAQGLRRSRTMSPSIWARILPLPGPMRKSRLWGRRAANIIHRKEINSAEDPTAKAQRKRLPNTGSCFQILIVRPTAAILMT